MEDQYTHNYKFESNGKWMHGECEFNTDGEASYKMTQNSEPLPSHVLDHFQEIMKLAKKIHDEDGSVKILIKPKD